MKTLPAATALAAFLALSACGNDTASSLNEAAEQSDPVAAQELQNEAAALDERGTDGSLSDPNAPAQQALQDAGNAAAGTAAGANTTVPAQEGAKPHAPGDPVPPPKTGAQ